MLTKRAEILIKNYFRWCYDDNIGHLDHKIGILAAILNFATEPAQGVVRWQK